MDWMWPAELRLSDAMVGMYMASNFWRLGLFMIWNSRSLFMLTWRLSESLVFFLLKKDFFILFNTRLLSFSSYFSYF